MVSHLGSIVWGLADGVLEEAFCGAGEVVERKRALNWGNAAICRPGSSCLVIIVQT